MQEVSITLWDMNHIEIFSEEIAIQRMQVS